MKTTHIYIFFFWGVLFSQSIYSQRSIDDDFEDPYISPVEEGIENELIGTWKSEENSSETIRFTSNELYRYYDGGLQNSYSYTICKTCNDETLNDSTLFLKTTNLTNGIEECFYLDNVNFEGNGILTMMTQKQGKILVYQKL